MYGLFNRELFCRPTVNIYVNKLKILVSFLSTCNSYEVETTRLGTHWTVGPTNCVLRKLRIHLLVELFQYYLELSGGFKIFDNVLYAHHGKSFTGACNEMGTVVKK